MTALRLSPVLAAWAELAAALVNTRPAPTDPPEKLAGRAELERAARPGAPEPAPAAARRRDLAPMRDLRDVAGAPPSRRRRSTSLAGALNPVLERRGGRRRMARARAAGRSSPRSRASRSPSGSAPGAARGLAELAIAYGIERLHMCAADDCLCAVVDVSRNGARRYCSRTCATRTNVRRHRLAH